MSMRGYLGIISALVISLFGCRNGKNNLNPQQQQLVGAFHESVETGLKDSHPDSALTLAMQDVQLADSLGDDLLLMEAMN